MEPSARPIPQAQWLSINPRVSLVPLEVVRAARAVTSEKVTQMVERGDFIHVFDFGTNRGFRHAWRFWVVEMAGLPRDLNLSIDDVIDSILPKNFTAFRLSDLILRFCLGRPTAHRLIRAIGRKNEAGQWRISRTRLEAFLRSRWVGSGLPVKSAIAKPLSGIKSIPERSAK